MTFSNANSNLMHAVIVTVCTGPEITSQLVQTIERKPWILSFFHFDTYLSAARRPSFGPQLRNASTCFAFVDFTKSPEEAVETTLYLTQTFPGKVTVIAIADQPDTSAILTAMRAGCSEFLSMPLDEAELMMMLERPEKAWATSSRISTKAAPVFAFFGAKGGVGTTTLAVHLAMYLVQVHKKRTLLIDHHHEFGHVCIYLGLDGSSHHFSELVRNVSRLDSELLHGFVAKHSSGLEVLASPDVNGGPRNMDPDAMSRALEFIRSEYDYVVVDCDIAMDELNRPIVDAASSLYLVASPEVGAIRDLSRRVDKFIQNETAAEKLEVVINRFSSPYAIHVEQIEKAMRLPVAIRIPNSYPELVRAMNLGEPIAPGSNSEFSSQFGKWADALVGAAGESSPEVKDSKLFSRWKLGALVY